MPLTVNPRNEFIYRFGLLYIYGLAPGIHPELDALLLNLFQHFQTSSGKDDICALHGILVSHCLTDAGSTARNKGCLVFEFHIFRF